MPQRPSHVRKGGCLKHTMTGTARLFEKTVACMVTNKRSSGCKMRALKQQSTVTDLGMWDACEREHAGDEVAGQNVVAPWILSVRLPKPHFDLQTHVWQCELASALLW